MLDRLVFSVSAAAFGMYPISRAVMQIIAASAFTYVCAVSSRSAEELHDAMEGLGMLAPLPAEPGEADGEALLQQLARFVAV